MSDVLSTEAVLSTEGLGVGVDLGGPGLWPPLTAATQVLRWAVLLARVSGVPLAGGGTGEVVQGSVVAQVVSVGPWVSVAVAAGLFCVQVIRRVRSGERGVGALVRYVTAVPGTTAVAVIAMRAADALTEVALARGPGAAELAVTVAQGPAGAADPGGVGSTAGPAALLLVWVSGWIYLVEMTCRLAVLLAMVAAIPLVAGGGRASATPVWRARALRWAIVAIVSKPLLTVVLMTGVSALVRSEMGSLRGSVGLVGGVAGLVLLVCGPITLLQFTHRLVSASAARGSCPGLLTRLIRGPARHTGAVDQRETPDAERRTSTERRPTPTRRRPSTRCEATVGRVVVELLAALRRWSTGLRRGSAARTGATAAAAAWPVVREVIAPAVPAVTPAVTGTHAGRQRRGPLNLAAEPPAEPVPHSDTPPSTAGASLSATTTSRTPGPGDALAADRAHPDGSSAGPCIGDGRPSGRVTAETPAGIVSAARPTGPGEASGTGAAAGSGSDPVARPPWALAILGRPTLLAVGSDGAGIGNADTASGRAGGGHDAGPGGVVAVEVTARLTPKMLELLVYLAVHPHGVRRDTVVTALWPDTARPRPANNLSALITRLRTALPCVSSSAATGRTGLRLSATAVADVGGLVTTDGDRYLIDPDHVRVDYWSFLAATDEAATARDAGDAGREPHLSDAALAALHAAHELYGGPLADGLDGEWVLSVREAARRSFLDTTARLVRHHVQDSPTVALRLLEKARNLDPANEKLYRDIIALQLQTGDDAGAERTLRLLETQLADIDETVSDSLAALARNIHRRQP
jgi:DNA-binding SARP family transcriptional activator